MLSIELLILKCCIFKPFYHGLLAFIIHPYPQSSGLGTIILNQFLFLIILMRAPALILLQICIFVLREISAVSNLFVQIPSPA